MLVADDDMDVIEGDGFLNMAMHTLVQDRQRHSITVPINGDRPLTATGGHGIDNLFTYRMHTLLRKSNNCVI